MRKLLILAIAATAFGMTSCKKEYTCSCTSTIYDTSDNSVLYGPTSSSTTIKDTKSKAKTACEKGTSTTESNGMKTVSTCAIK